jgi:hypothetical protein
VLSSPDVLHMIVCKLGAEVMQTFDDVEQTKILQRCMRSP